MRYRAALERVTDELSMRPSGLGVVGHPVSERAAVLAALRDQVPAGAVWAPVTAALIDAPPSTWVATIETGDVALMERLNRVRDALVRRAWVLLVVDRRQLEALQRHAPDLVSAPSFVINAAFEPDPEVDLEQARAALMAWQDEAYGRIDLRGLARSEGEDVAFRVVDLYQGLEAHRTEMWTLEAAAAGALEGPAQPLIDVLRADTCGPRHQVVLGAPGSGKTFFLRWLALTPNALDPADAQVASIFVPLTSLGPLGGLRTLTERVTDRLLAECPLAAHALGRWAAAGQLRWLLDGLDEVGDATSRAAMVAELGTFVAEWSSCDVFVTSRVVGYQSAPLPEPFRTARLAPFSEQAVRGFLMSWTRAYAVQSRGSSPRVVEDARASAELLAADILGNPRLRSLAESPLLLTLIAILHRTGVRLPNNRVELYEHATRVLVERWNRVRSGMGSDAPPPIGAADAVRLLGPVALASLQRTNRGQIFESELRDVLAARLGRTSTSLSSVDEAVELFQRTLGVLVETGPGVFGFLHLTLAEYFAARELLRTKALEALAADPDRAFRPEWREVILLAASELGVVRAEDERLDGLVEVLVANARGQDVDGESEVVELLNGFLKDDPCLSNYAVIELVHELIPKWWLSPRGAVQALGISARGRRWKEPVRARLNEAIQSSAMGTSWPRQEGGVEMLYAFCVTAVFRALELDASALFARALRERRTLVMLAVESRGRYLAELPLDLVLAGRVDGKHVLVRFPAASDTVVQLAELAAQPGRVRFREHSALLNLASSHATPFDPEPLTPSNSGLFGTLTLEDVGSTTVGTEADKSL